MAWRGWETWTPAQGGPAPTKRAKYGAVPTTVDGVRFDSAKEATRYGELKVLEQAGEIWDLELQPRFVLLVPSTSGQLMRAATAITQGGTFKLGEYRGDFKYHDKSGIVVEDVKGFKTPLYRWKKKHVEAQYGIVIRET